MWKNLIQSYTTAALAATFLVCSASRVEAQKPKENDRGDKKAAVSRASVEAQKPKEADRGTKKAAASKKKDKAKKAQAAEEPIKLAQAVAMMDSNKSEDVEAGIQSLGLLGTPDAVEPLVRRIRRGLPPNLLETAIMTLMALGQPSSGPMLFELSAHRRPEIRLRALEAIAAINPPGAEGVLVTALSDGDMKVRSRAAISLGEIGAKGALDTLFIALDRGITEASEAIGRVVPADRIERLLGYLNKVALGSLGPALVQVLERKDIAEPAKIEVVVRLQELGTAEAKSYLTDFLAKGGKDIPAALAKAVRSAIQQIGR